MAYNSYNPLLFFSVTGNSNYCKILLIHMLIYTFHGMSIDNWMLVIIRTIFTLKMLNIVVTQSERELTWIQE